jgi:signal transduction histidine kinase
MSSTPSPFLAEAHQHLLQLAAGGAPLSKLLPSIAQTAAASAPAGARTVVFLRDASEPSLRVVAVHDLPPSYTNGVDRFPIGPLQPSCGLAASTGEEVIVQDITQDPAWQPYLMLAYAHGIRASWSFPLRTAGGKTLGTLAVYLPQPRSPEPGERAQLRVLANIASVAVAREADARERDAAETELRDTINRKDVFIAVLGHELRNPLGALRNSLHILGRRELPEPIPRVLGLMNEQVQQLIRLTDDLLDASRIARGKLEMRMERIELHSAVRHAIEAAKPLCGGKNQQLEYEPLPELVYLQADATRVTQMVSNLLTNASKFTPAGGEIRVTLERAEGSAVIRVRDSGSGIAADQTDKIFQMFAQLDEGKKFSTQGLGIGLPLVKYLAGSHGGTIEVQSPGIGQGSEFILRLPLKA